MDMRIIDDMDELKEFLSSRRTFHLYSAGFASTNFLRSLKECGIEMKLESILVTELAQNPDRIGDVPVVKYDREKLGEEDCILLTVSERFKKEIATHLKDCRAEVVYPSPVIFYNDVFDSIKPFAKRFPNGLSRLNLPAGSLGKVVWSCWWQGEEEAPDIVKACWESQKRNLPDDVRHIVITKDNYSEYIEIPVYVLEKFKDGKNLLAHLADLIRTSLLYKHGGVWLDATVLLLDLLPDECWELPLYTWRFDNTHFSSRTIWTTWFLAAQKGSMLFQFVMEAFYFYFSVFDKVKYYLTIDYFISICSNLFDQVLEQFQQIPYNNENAANLNAHLNEVYSEQLFFECCKGTFLQKLNRHWKACGGNTVYDYIINKYLNGQADGHQGTLLISGGEDAGIIQEASGKI